MFRKKCSERCFFFFSIASKFYASSYKRVVGTVSYSVVKKNTTPKLSVMLGWLPELYEAKPARLELVMSEFWHGIGTLKHSSPVSHVKPQYPILNIIERNGKAFFDFWKTQLYIDFCESLCFKSEILSHGKCYVSHDLSLCSQNTLVLYWWSCLHVKYTSLVLGVCLNT